MSFRLSSTSIRCVSPFPLSPFPSQRHAPSRRRRAAVFAAPRGAISKGDHSQRKNGPLIPPKTARAAPLTCHCPPLQKRCCTRCAKDCLPIFIAAFDLACAYVRLAATAAGFREKFSTAARTSTAAAAERKEKHAKSFRRKTPPYCSQKVVQYGQFGGQGACPLRSLGVSKGPFSTVENGPFDMCAAHRAAGIKITRPRALSRRCAARRAASA